MTLGKSMLFIVLLTVIASSVMAGTSAYVSGYVLDPNWYAPHRKSAPPSSGTDYGLTGYTGWGLYEYGVAGNPNNNSALGFYDDTNIYGMFSRTGQTDGTYCLASWDVWWRSAYIFNKAFNAFSTPVPIKLHANMWTYALNWGGHSAELGQTFEATGSSVTMISFYAPDDNSSVKWKVSVHEGGPTGAQIGPSQTRSAGGDIRMRWSGGQIPTVPGNTYYVKFQALDPATNLPTTGALGVNDPVPDMSDPMPGGCMYIDGVPQGGLNDLALTICSDDDGLLTNLWVGKSDTMPSVASAGQTFVARGASLVSFCAWIPQNNITFKATLYDAVNGTPVGMTKRNRVMRGGDPEVMWLWSPGECPLVPGNTYYIEVTRDDGANFPVMYSRWNEYWGGEAYFGRVAQATYDLCGTIMEEESTGSATQPAVQISDKPFIAIPDYPQVNLADRTPTSLIVRWTTDVNSDSTVEYAEWNCPYTDTCYDSTLTKNHAVTLTGLKPNTMYHLRVKSAASGYKTGVHRDFTACTTDDPSSPNLLVNPGFEEGSGASPRTVSGWTCSGMDIKASDGSWFWGVKPFEGDWLCQGAINGGNCNGFVAQRVPVVPGKQYNFTCAISSWMRENSTWKYDEWEKQGRLDYLRIGFDPTGGTDPNGFNVKWGNRFYSHLRYNQVGARTTAQSNYITVFINLQGYGGDWHLYGLDDCRLTAVNNYTAYELKGLKSQADGIAVKVSDLIITATPAEAGAYYAQTQDRSQGIRIESAETVAVGKNVAVNGTLQTMPNGERYLAGASFTSTANATEPKPMMMLSSAVGGSEFGTVPAMPESKGPHNTALVVKVAGTVTVKAADSSYVFISDGSLAGNGIRVDTSRVSSSVVPNVGDVVAVSGISSAYVDGTRKPMIIARRAGDISADLNP